MHDGKKEEFKKLMDEIVDAFLHQSANADSALDITSMTKNLLNILLNLNQQIDELRGRLQKREDHEKRVEKDLKLLIQELKDQGYISIGERRKLLKRTVLGQEALIQVLISKGLIKKSTLIEEIRKMNSQEKLSSKS
jgi:hypothetical protein